jgi:hypothetical protein
MLDMHAATVQWLAAATFAKACGATDPAAVVSQAAREWEDSCEQRGDAYDPFNWVPAHIRRIQVLAEEQTTNR